MNDAGTPHYYEAIIKDPTSGLSIVAPFIKYHLHNTHAEVSLTYGANHPIHTQPLLPIPVDYFTPVLAPEQLRILDPTAPFAHEVKNIVDIYMPYELSATIGHYQHYQEASTSISKTIRILEKKRAMYQEKMMSLSESLEGANFLGRLMSYDEDIMEALEEQPIALAEYNEALRHFIGPITQNALDPRINPWRVNHRLPQVFRDAHKEFGTETAQSLKKPRFENTHTTVHDEDDESYTMEAHLIETQQLNRLEDRRARRIPHRRPKDTPPIIPQHTYKRCHNCRRPGHIRANCPHFRPAHERFPRAKL